MEAGGGITCFGLPEKQCPQRAFLRGLLLRAGPDYVTPGMTRTCRIEFCNPLCLHAVKCHVKAEGEFAVAASGDYSEALCRQVIGKACLDTGCCKDKDVSVKDLKLFLLKYSSDNCPFPARSLYKSLISVIF